MGFEAFRVDLRGGQSTLGDVEEVIRKLLHVKPDPQAVPVKGSSFYVMDDGRHVLELELMGSPARASCRFTLCHPSSVDAVFLGFVRELMLRLGMEAKICDDVRPEHARSFSLEEFADFAAITSGYIVARRAEWTAAFGNQPLAATTNEVHERMIRPQCQEEIEPPGAVVWKTIDC